MELVILGFNVLILMVLWKFMLRRTILDHSRDKLFDLRSELRSTYIAKGWDLNSPTYKRLRDLVNGHLRYTEDMSLSRAIVLAGEVNGDEELKKFMRDRLQTLFSATSGEQREHANSFRQQSQAVALEYLVFSSGYFLLLTFLLMPFFAVGMVISLINRHVEITAGKCLQYFRHFSVYGSTLMSRSAAYIAKLLLLSNAVDAYSYRRGLVS